MKDSPTMKLLLTPLFLTLLLPIRAEIPDFTDPDVPAPKPISDEEFSKRPKLTIQIDSASKCFLEGAEMSSEQLSAVFAAVSKIEPKTVLVFRGAESKSLITQGSKLLRLSGKVGITEARFKND